MSIRMFLFSGRRKADDAKQYLEENYYHTELSLKIVAEEIGVNSSYLSNIFKKEFNYSSSRYMIKVRMEQAAFYIEQQSKVLLSQLTLSELAEGLAIQMFIISVSLLKIIIAFLPLNT